MPTPKAQLVAPIENISIPGASVTGVVTSTGGFGGDITGTATGIVASSNLTVGVMTATSFKGDVTGNVTGSAGGLSGSPTIHVGVVTATAYSGDGSNLTGLGGSAFTSQTVAVSGATVTLDLSKGNNINFEQSASTTVSFANTSSGAMSVTIIRTKDASETARTITWPSNVNWDGATEPTLINNATSNERQQFKFLTPDSGVTWYAWEDFSFEGGYQLWAWGQNPYGSLGLNDAIERSSPTQVGTSSLWSAGSLGTNDEFVFQMVKADGTLWTWGYNNNVGILGLNGPGTQAISSPIQVGTDTNWAQTGGASDNMVATKTDGTLWIWGYNGYGAICQGQPEATNVSSPVQVTGETNYDTTYKKLAADGRSFACIRTDGTLWYWGSNYQGKSGSNYKPGPAPSGRGYFSSPIQLPGLTWDKVAIGNHSTFAIKTDGSLWSWGYNGDGVLGHNNAHPTGSVSSPTQIPGTTWSDVAGGEAANYVTALKSDGTMWSWGYNTWGQLGHNDKTKRSSPTQIPGTTWSKITKMQGGATAIKTDGTLWVWGADDEGALGQNSLIRYSSPIQVGTDTTWSVGIPGGKGSVAALKG